MAAQENMFEIRKIRRMEGDLRATTTAGTETRRTKIRTQIRDSLFLKTSLEIVDTIADCRLSKTAQLSATTITIVNPTTQEGSSVSKRKNARPPYVPGFQTPAHAAMKPVELTRRRRTIKSTAVAMDAPTHKSLSVFDANARIQKLDRNMKLKRIPINRIL